MNLFSLASRRSKNKTFSLLSSFSSSHVCFLVLTFHNNTGVSEEKAKTIFFGFEIESKLFRSNGYDEKEQWKFSTSTLL